MDGRLTVEKSNGDVQSVHGGDGRGDVGEHYKDAHEESAEDIEPQLIRRTIGGKPAKE